MAKHHPESYVEADYYRRTGMFSISHRRRQNRSFSARSGDSADLGALVRSRQAARIDIGAITAALLLPGSALKKKKKKKKKRKLSLDPIRGLTRSRGTELLSTHCSTTPSSKRSLTGG
jgi:hypothetical protein